MSIAVNEFQCAFVKHVRGVYANMFNASIFGLYWNHFNCTSRLFFFKNLSFIQDGFLRRWIEQHPLFSQKTFTHQKTFLSSFHHQGSLALFQWTLSSVQLASLVYLPKQTKVHCFPLFFMADSHYFDFISETEIHKPWFDNVFLVLLDVLLDFLEVLFGLASFLCAIK